MTELAVVAVRRLHPSLLCAPGEDESFSFRRGEYDTDTNEDDDDEDGLWRLWLGRFDVMPTTGLEERCAGLSDGERVLRHEEEDAESDEYEREDGEAE